jgi:multiple sugar transport system permease protein
MGIISEIGRKDIKVRLLVWSISILLTLGAITMLYPFLLMIAGSSKSGVDTTETKLIPSFFYNDAMLYRKTVEAMFNEDSEAFQSTYDIENGDFKKVEPPKAKDINYALIDEWLEFLQEKQYPHFYYGLGFVGIKISRSSAPLNLRKFKSIIYNRFDGNLEAANRAMETEFVAWNVFRVFPALYLTRRRMPDSETELNIEYWKFKEKQPFNLRYYFSPEGFYKAIFLRAQYTKSISAYNKHHKTNYKSWDEVKLPQEYPAGKKYTDAERRDWDIFVRQILNMFWVRVDKKALPLYRQYLRAKYPELAELNRLYESNYKSFDEIPLVIQVPFFGAKLSDWATFIRGWTAPNNKVYKVPSNMLSVHAPEYQFRDYLKAKFKTIPAFSKAIGKEYANWNDINPPQRDLHYSYITNNSAALKWEFSKRNFIAVSDYILLHGRGVWNTFIYCGLAILCALIVNPLAAYALSRFKPPSTYKVLLFLMLTMAFPPMVTQIPTFLMLREFDLLNTYAALILPGLANGYSIFLLKGFFDSLPQELYESAMIDGASECRIFLQITMSLSKPILAVIALQAFNLAYTNFMMALLYCQDQNMWTLMPWLYQLQMRSCQGVTFASLIIAAIPTFLVFVFCQNIIMRGIVVPVEK